MPQKLSSFALLTYIIDRPGLALSNVVAYPRWRWVLPTVLALIGIAIAMLVMAPLLAEQAHQQTSSVMSSQLSQLSPDQAARVQQQVDMFQSPLVVGGLAAVLATIGMALGWLLQAGIIYFGALVAGGDVQYGPLLAAAPWLGIPFVIENFLQAAWVRVNGHLLVNQGLSYLVSSGKQLQDARNFAYVALGQLTLFRLWNLVLVYMLLRAVAKVSRGTAFIVTVIYFALLVGVQLAFAAVSRLAGGTTF